MNIKIVNQSNNPLPAYKTIGSAGMDLHAFIQAPIQLASLERCLVPTGLYLQLPLGYEAQIRPRSGLAIKKGLSMPNTPGTIDSDYRGELKVPMINLSRETQTINSGDRIAQMVIAKHETVMWTVVEQLEESERGSGGFGSTGTK